MTDDNDKWEAVLPHSLAIASLADLLVVGRVKMIDQFQQA